MNSIRCCSCGIVFGMAEAQHDALRESGESFYCPLGHRQHFTRPPSAEQLQRELETWKARAVSWDFRAARWERIAGDRLVKLRTCPLCSASFRSMHDLAPHLTDRHGASERCMPLGLPAPKREAGS